VDEGLSAAQLVGTWRLLRWQTLIEGGSTGGPLGETPLGYVVYTQDGRMLTTISRVDRAPIGGDLLSGPDAGRLEAFASFVAYSGTFRVEGASVIHTVEMSLFPDWVGSEQRRSVELSPDGQRLTLSTQLAAGGRSGRQVLTWERL
jgi:hypothetical protein